MTDFPFTTDGCSGGMSRTWRFVFRRPPPWEGLCVDHDRKYHPGGTREERRAADRELRDAVARKGYPAIAFFMWLAIRAGGHPLLPLPWRWGFGWRWPRGYRQPGK